MQPIGPVSRARGPRRVLLADDDQATRQRLADWLARLGFDVLPAEDGSELLDAIGDQLLNPTRHPPCDLLIAGADMPFLSGVHALSALRELSWDTPCILLSDRPAGLEEISTRLGAVVLPRRVKPARLLEAMSAASSRGPTDPHLLAHAGGSPPHLDPVPWAEVIDALPEMITIHDADFNIVAANATARQRLGLARRPRGHRKCFRAYHGSDTIPEGCPSCRVLQTRQPTRFTMNNPHLDATIEVTAVPRLDERGAVHGVVHVVRELQASAALEQEQQLALLKRQVEELADQANTDHLTQAYNRRWLKHNLERELARAERHARALSVALFDLDGLKQINDQLGHAAGDTVLRQVAGQVRQGMRRIDALVRWGGDEFLLLLPETGLEEALASMERLRAEVTLLELPSPVSISCGVSAFRDGDTPATLITRVDQALYRAKHNGRNRVEQAL